MNRVKQTSVAGLKSEILSVSQLADLYNGNMAELHLCANINPALEGNTDDADMREASLLDFEANLLEQAARVPLRTKADLQGLMDIWKNLSTLQSDEYPTPSDRIVMNIFRHLSDDNFRNVLSSKG